MIDSFDKVDLVAKDSEMDQSISLVILLMNRHLRVIMDLLEQLDLFVEQVPLGTNDHLGEEAELVNIDGTVTHLDCLIVTMARQCVETGDELLVQAQVD